MLDALISSKTRLKLLLKFFINPQQVSYLRGLAAEFGESTNAVRVELNRLEKASLVQSKAEGNRVMFRVNTRHPLFGELRSIVLKHLGLDKLVDHFVAQLGQLEQVYLTGDMARGMDGNIIDMVLVGDLDMKKLMEMVEKAQTLLGRKIKFVVYRHDEQRPEWLNGEDSLLLWER
ncbi:MAG: winged helix-turn-helix transcriptional regulator [Bacteroidetes bacterium]|nr:winged helix-turn-helix transcriptional regulator [Bacteroidota bacterium]